MKILNYNDYRYVGRKGLLHCFVSVRRKFDPEILWLAKAKMIKVDGSFAYFDPIAESNEVKNSIDYVYSGVDSDGNKYTFSIKLDGKSHAVWRNQSAVRVNQPVREERIPKRRLVKHENLIKTHFATLEG